MLICFAFYSVMAVVSFPAGIEGLASGSLFFSADKDTRILPFLDKLFPARGSSQDRQGSKNTSCQCGWTNKPKVKIIGGRETSPHEIPWIVLLEVNNNPYCGGSIIAPKYVLTATHCIVYAQDNQITVYAGVHDKRERNTDPNVQKVDVAISHDYSTSYDTKNNIHDISILELKKAFEFSQFIGPICLPNPQERPPIVENSVTVMGWGRTKRSSQDLSNVLMEVDLYVINLQTCKNFFRSTLFTEPPSQICTWAPDKDSCQGDSGGPLAWNDPKTNSLTQIAIVSYGRSCATMYPAVNTDVFAHIDWINNIIKESSPETSICTI